MKEKHSVYSVFQSLQGETQPSDSHMTADAQSFLVFLICCFGNSALRTSWVASTTARARWTSGRPASWSAASRSSSNRAEPTNTSVGWGDDDWGAICAEKSNTLYLFLQWRALSCRKPERASTRPTPATGTPPWTVGSSARQQISLSRSFIPNNCSTTFSSERSNAAQSVSDFVLVIFFFLLTLLRAGSSTVRWENRTMYCVVSVFAVAVWWMLAQCVPVTTRGPPSATRVRQTAARHRFRSSVARKLQHLHTFAFCLRLSASSLFLFITYWARLHFLDVIVSKSFFLYSEVKKNKPLLNVWSFSFNLKSFFLFSLSSFGQKPLCHVVFLCLPAAKLLEFFFRSS